VELGPWVRGLAGLFLVLPLAHCSSGEEGTEREETPNWQCFEGGACACSKFKYPASSTSSNSVDLCAGYNCCLLGEPKTPSSLAECNCLNTEATCDAEAASRPGTEVISQCPPPGEGPDPNEGCAVESESCDSDYLSSNGLRSCCPGTICEPNAEQRPVCRAASPDEEAAYLECLRTVQTLEVVTPSIRTSVGDVVLADVGDASATVGPLGCLNRFSVTLLEAGECSLWFVVELRDGALRLAGVYGNLTRCEGYTGPDELFGGAISESDPELVPFEFSFRGLSCPNDYLDSYCLTGEFDFHLEGEVDGIAFDDQHLVLQGTVCAVQVMGDCPP
jgi:hypothetical protein